MLDKTAEEALAQRDGKRIHFAVEGSGKRLPKAGVLFDGEKRNIGERKMAEDSHLMAKVTLSALPI